MTAGDREADARRLSVESYARADPTGWFEQLYRESALGEAIVPWDRGTPNVLLVEWAATRNGAGQSAVVVGCGLGRDSEYVASLGYRTSAFDISETAIQGARERHPGSPVQYEAVDLLALPAHYRAGFDLVVESYTVQALPDPPRAQAIAAVRTLVAPGGTLIVIAAARDDDTAVDGPPWPLTRAEVEAFAADGLRARQVSRLVDAEGKSRWRAEFGRTPV